MIEELKKWGCNTAGAMERLLNDESFYRECLLEILADPHFDRLGQALRSHDIQAAFESAHSLKGVLANLGLSPMCETVVTMVEPLRKGTDEGLLPRYEELMQQKAQLKKILEE